MGQGGGTRRWDAEASHIGGSGQWNGEASCIGGIGRVGKCVRVHEY